MKHFWKIVMIVFALLLLAGIILAGAGFLTGGSPERIAELRFGGWDGLRAAAEAIPAQLPQP